MNRRKPTAACDHRDIPTGHECPRCGKTIIRPATDRTLLSRIGNGAGGWSRASWSKRYDYSREKE